MIVPVFLPHAGCPHRCVFCNQAAITRAPSDRPPESELENAIVRFLGYSPQRHSTVQIAFFGGNFLGQDTAAIHACLTLAQRFVEDDRVESIRFSTRPDTIDRQRLHMLAGYRVRTIELGAQSMVDEVLDRSQRGHTAAHTTAAVKRLKAEGYAVGLQMMVGLPGDTAGRAVETAQRLVDLQPDFIRIYPTIVLKGSLLAAWYHAGRYTPLSLENAIDQVKELYLIFYRAGIPVIRMGLQTAGELITDDKVVAGPCHPAFGHLVHAALFLEMADRLLAHRPRDCGAALVLQSHPRSISKLNGLKRGNIEALRRRYRLPHLAVEQDPFVPEDGLRLRGGEAVVSYRDLAVRPPP
ncbi:MAG: radical SAM protein [Desulfobacterales bacterium]